MNDKLILDNYLLILKSSVEVYVHGTLESSNKDILQLLKHGLDEVMNSQANCYNEMVSRGYYKISNINSKEIEKTLKNVEN